MPYVPRLIPDLPVRYVRHPAEENYCSLCNPKLRKASVGVLFGSMSTIPVWTFPGSCIQHLTTLGDHIVYVPFYMRASIRV